MSVWIPISWIVGATIVIVCGVFVGEHGWHARDNAGRSEPTGFVVLLGAVVAALGAIGAQYGWNLLADTRQRVEMVAALSEAASSNLARLMDPTGDRTNYRPAETEQFAAATVSGLFSGKRYADLGSRVRRAHSALAEFNYSLSFSYQNSYMAAGPRDLPEFAERARLEVSGVQELLVANYGMSVADGASQ
jgi:hypothetical protein